MASLDTVLSRVKKLLALSTSSNLHEAASAYAAAQALITRYQLSSLLAGTSDDQRDPITDGREQPLQRARRFRRWKLFLASGLAAENAGIAWTDDVDDETWLCFCGFAKDREAVVVLWSSLVTRIEWLSATHGPGRCRQWHEAFRIGAAEAIVKRLGTGELTIGTDDDVADGTAGLVLSTARPLRAARVAAVEAFAGRVLPSQKGRAVLVDRRAAQRGRAAANAWNL
jgi:hypothetical protein